MKYHKSEVMSDRCDPNAAKYPVSRITQGVPTRRRICLFSLLGFSLLLAGCSDGGDSPQTPNPYAAAELWMCKPGAASNRCLELDQTITNIYSDTSQAVFEHTPAVDPDFDCFYVYPTVDFREEPGNTEDLTDDGPALGVLYNQAARFTELCNMYAPLYRQQTIGAINLEGDYRNTEYYDVAFGDVEQAFNQYLYESGDRPFVLIGHSQGTHMLLELLLQRFEDDPKLRGRLISALMIGDLGPLIRPEGRIKPDSFENIPLCTHATQTGCIINYNTIAAGGFEERVADSRACVNPTQLGGNPGVLENTIWAAGGLPTPDTVETPWMGYPGLHTANCEPDGYLAIDTIDEERKPPLSPQVLQAAVGGDTLHIADVNWAIGDLLRIVATQAENMP